MSSTKTPIDSQTVANRIDFVGAAPSIKTLSAFELLYKLGDDMRNGYTTRKAETLNRLHRESMEAQASGDPTKAAEGLLIEAFIIGWIGADKIGK